MQEHFNLAKYLKFTLVIWKENDNCETNFCNLKYFIVNNLQAFVGLFYVVLHSREKEQL